MSTKWKYAAVPASERLGMIRSGNKDVYERLVKAAVSVDENKLKDLIYHNFIIEIDNDLDDHDIQLGNVMKRKVVAFLNNEIVHDFLLRKKGPIERMYSKIAEHSTAPVPD